MINFRTFSRKGSRFLKRILTEENKEHLDIDVNANLTLDERHEYKEIAESLSDTHEIDNRIIIEILENDIEITKFERDYGHHNPGIDLILMPYIMAGALGLAKGKIIGLVMYFPFVWSYKRFFYSDINVVRKMYDDEIDDTEKLISLMEERKDK